MRFIQPFRTAFTMIELILAIVILGIVSSIGAEIITQTYESYIVQRAQYRANSKTELALSQIANRLRYAIPHTIVARPSLAGASTRIEIVTDPNMKVLQWVGYDGDSFEAITSDANRRPGWSGFADLLSSDQGSINSPGSFLDLARTIIGNLGGGIGDAQIFFADGNPNGYGISDAFGEVIELDSNIPAGDTITERYKLAWSSYALEVDADNDLYLHYHFAPIPEAPINGTSSLLLHDVTNFRFKYSGGAFRLKICKTEPISADANATVHACKERVVF